MTDNDKTVSIVLKTGAVFHTTDIVNPRCFDETIRGMYVEGLRDPKFPYISFIDTFNRRITVACSNVNYIVETGIEHDDQ